MHPGDIREEEKTNMNTINVWKYYFLRIYLPFGQMSY